MDKIVNGIMKGLDYFNMKEYLTRMIYQPEDLQKEFKKEKKRIDEMFDMSASQIRNRRELLKTLGDLIEHEEVERRSTVITN